MRRDGLTMRIYLVNAEGTHKGLSKDLREE